MAKFAFFASLLAGATPVLGGLGFIHNQCGTQIYCRTVKAHPQDRDSGASKVPAHSVYQTPFAIVNDNIGVSIKCGFDPNVVGHPHYQLEGTIDRAGKQWYDLSAVDGAIFRDQRRFVQVGGSGACPVILCDAGSTSCEWPFQVACQNSGDIHMYFC